MESLQLNFRLIKNNVIGLKPRRLGYTVNISIWIAQFCKLCPLTRVDKISHNNKKTGNHACFFYEITHRQKYILVIRRVLFAREILGRFYHK